MAIRTIANFRNQLESNLRTHSAKTNQPLQRVRRKVAYDRFLARIATQEPPNFFLKGGYAMELRIARARATKDMDLSCVKRVHKITESVSESILQELQKVARIDLNDHFTYRVKEARKKIESAPYGGSRHSISVSIADKPYADFHLDVGIDCIVGTVEKIRGTNWLEFCNIAAPVISMISIEQQFAEKIHCYTLPRDRPNSRTKDLVDMILLLNINNKEPEAFRYALQKVFKARNTHVIPTVLQPPPQSWKEPFDAMAAECGISNSLNDGFKQVCEFYSVLQDDTKVPIAV